VKRTLALTGVVAALLSGAIAAGLVFAARSSSPTRSLVAPLGFAPSPTGPAAAPVATYEAFGYPATATFADAAARPAAPKRVAVPPPAMTFTPNTRADIAEGATQNQNEPQVAVDQTGRAYVYWQGNNRLSWTDDGATFTYVNKPIPTGNTGDTALATTTWPSFSHTPSTAGSGDNGVFLSILGMNNCGAFEMKGATSKDRGASWSPVEITCQPAQVDRNWTAAYTPPAYRGTSGAVSHTFVYNQYHDFGPSNIWVQTSPDGGATYPMAPTSAIQPGSTAEIASFCNTIPGGIAVDQRGAHMGRVYSVWTTSDLVNNAGQGCNITQAEAFDHIFLSYSDDNGQTWTSRNVFNDPCAPNPVQPPVSPTTCQDMSEIFTSVAVDDAGNVFIAFVFRDINQTVPEYDVYVVKSSDGGNTWSAKRKVNTGTGTHYFPWIAAGAADAIDVVYYDTTTIEGVGTGNKPAAAPHTATWTVKLAQSFDGGLSFTDNQVSTAGVPIYFGDICTTGIFCGNGAAFGWGDDRILLDDFGVAIGPDGGARVAWTDARESHGGQCTPTGTSAVSCQKTHLYFACQKSGTGLHGETLSGCGVSSTTGVTVQALHAKRGTRGVTVTWKTAAETGLAGFNVYREQRGGRVRANHALIRATGGALGHTYSFVDRRAPRGASTRFWVQQVLTSGAKRWYGPVRTS
jgi:hypothetical protein